MTIFYMELKKIWNPPIVFLLVILMAVNFAEKNEWTANFRETIGNNHDDFVVMMELTETFGSTLEEEEFPEAMEMLVDIQRELDEIIKNHPDYSPDLVEEFSTIEYLQNRYYYEDKNNDDMDLVVYLYENHLDLLSKERNYREILNIYEEKMSEPSNNRYFIFDYEQMELAQTQWDEGKGRSLVPIHLEYLTQDGFATHFFDTFSYILLLLLPTIVRDRKNKMRELQWTTVTGRKILKYQFMAHFTTALLILIPSPFLFLHYFNFEIIRYFWNHSMLFFQYGYGYLLDFTYIELLICYFIFAFVSGLVLSGVIFLLSQYSKNYPTLILKAIPLGYLIYAMGELWSTLFTLKQRQIGRTSVPWSGWSEVYFLLFAVFAVGVILFFTFCYEKSCDLLEK